MHRVSGGLIYLIAKANVLVGFYISYGGYRNNYDIFLYVIFGFTLFWRVLLEVVYRVYKGTMMKVLFYNNEGAEGMPEINDENQ
jgi:hypothetical protein